MQCYAIDTLERRSYLSITWTNENIGIGFDSPGAGEAIAEIHDAIALWQKILPSASVNVQIGVQDLSGSGTEKLGNTSVDHSGNALILFDDDAAGNGWYFGDPNSDDALYTGYDTANGTAAPTPFARQMNLGGNTDFFSVALHELGHALNFTAVPGVAGSGVPQDTHTDVPNDLMYASISPNTRRSISSLDAFDMQHVVLYPNVQPAPGVSNLVTGVVTASNTYPDRVQLTWTPAPFADHYLIYTVVDGQRVRGVATPPGSGTQGSYTVQGNVPPAAIYQVIAEYTDTYFGKQDFQIGEAVGSLSTKNPPPIHVPPTAALNRHPYAYVGRNKRYAYFGVVFNGTTALDTTSIQPLTITGKGGFTAQATASSTQSINGGDEIVATFVIRNATGWSTADLGAYAVTLPSGGVRDMLGDGASSASLGRLKLAFA